MILYQEAYQKIITLAEKNTLDVEMVALSDSIGRVLAKDMKAPITVQPFDNSAMDGFALRFEDIANATSEMPVTLRKKEIIAAGDAPIDTEVTENTVMHIMTGAVVPKGANVVVPIENVIVDGADVTFSSPALKHANIRFAGEDFKAGDCVAMAGTKLTSAHILPFASLGIDQLPVYRQLKSAFIATGGELIDDLAQSLEAGQIYNANRPYMVRKLEEAGTDCIAQYTVHDDPALFQNMIKNAMEEGVDVIVSTGAVSMGAFDFVRPALEKIGAEIIFHKVKMKPGKPNLCAVLPNGAIYFGLPGNPVSSAVGFRFFVQPFIEACLQLPAEKPIMAVAQNNFLKRAGMRIFTKAMLDISKTGQAQVTFLDGQASFMVRPFFEMNAWAVCEEAQSEIKAGECVPVYKL